MELLGITANIENGSITCPNKEIDLQTIAWQAHPAFKGVNMKHLIMGKETGGRFSCHLVKVDPGCALEEHAHADQWELHTILDGEGHCQLGLKSTQYLPGHMAIIPQEAKHRVEAGIKGLVLMAQFFPALL
jgi:quercetin dioxygenase-like cupin family protein